MTILVSDYCSPNTGQDVAPAIQAAVNALPKNDVLVFDKPGKYDLADTVEFRDKVFCRIEGGRAWLRSLPGVAEKTMLRFLGCGDTSVADLRIQSTHGAKCVISQGRSATRGSGRMTFERLSLSGDCELATVYSCCAEITAWRDCYILTQNAEPAYLDARFDVGEEGFVESSNVQKVFDHCTLSSKGPLAADKAVIRIYGGLEDFYLVNACYVGTGGRGVVIDCTRPDGVGARINSLTLSGVRVEGRDVTIDQSGSRLIRYDMNQPLSGLAVRSVRYAVDGQPAPAAAIEIVDGGLSGFEELLFDTGDVPHLLDQT